MTKAAALAFLAALALALPAAAAPGQIQAVQPWSRPAAAGTNAVGYLTLSNRGRTPDALVSAESPWARAVEVHLSTMSGGVMRMSRQSRVPIAPGRAVELKPGGLHLMFIGMKRPLNAGDRLPAVLTFSSGARVVVVLDVASGAGHAH